MIVQDDIERDFGNCNIKKSGSANGHNGIRSIQDAINTKVNSKPSMVYRPATKKKDAPFSEV